MTTTSQYDYLDRLTSVASVYGSSTMASSWAYEYNDINQRVRGTQPDGTFWMYNYDRIGQVISGRKFWVDGTPVAGQQFDYNFDAIGNRTCTQTGGDANGVTRPAAYVPDLCNQYSQRAVPAAFDVIGAAAGDGNLTVNGTTPYRYGEYFRQEIAVTGAPKWQAVNVTIGTSTATGTVFIPASPENYTYDCDGNLLTDGRWQYTWDTENRLIKLTSINSGDPIQSVSFAYDWKGRRIQKHWVLSATPNNPGDEYYVYNGWNQVVTLNPGSSLKASYTWGLDMSGSMQGAGGVGGLLWVTEASTGTALPN